MIRGRRLWGAFERKPGGGGAYPGWFAMVINLTIPHTRLCVWRSSMRLQLA
jgi:hypothetical protein